jgi:hypothetical protein
MFVKRESLEQRLYFLWGLINIPLAILGLVAEHTRALVAYVVVLGSPLTHLSLIVFI